MSTFDADAFLDNIRAARDLEAVDRPSKSLSRNVFDVDDFLHSIQLARQIELLEESRALASPMAAGFPLVVEQPAMDE